MAPKAKTTTQAPEVPATDQAADQQAQQEQQLPAAEASPEGETQAPATAGAADGQAAGAAAHQDTATQQVLLVDVRVLAAVTIDGERFLPDDVIEGMPDSVAQAYAGSVDSHPDAVAYARSFGVPAKPFPGQAHAED